MHACRINHSSGLKPILIIDVEIILYRVCCSFSSVYYVCRELHGAMGKQDHVLHSQCVWFGHLD